MDATLPYRPVHNLPKTVSGSNYETVNAGSTIKESAAKIKG